MSSSTLTKHFRSVAWFGVLVLLAVGSVDTSEEPQRQPLQTERREEEPKREKPSQGNAGSNIMSADKTSHSKTRLVDHGERGTWLGDDPSLPDTPEFENGTENELDEEAAKDVAGAAEKSTTGGETITDAPEIGMSLAELISERSEPKGRLDTKEVSILYYEDMNVVVEGGKVTQVHCVQVSEDPEPAQGGGEEWSTGPISKMLLTEEILSNADLTPRGKKMHRGRVARKAIEEGADPELVGAWVGGGFEGIGDYYRRQREARSGQAGEE